jgi:hypothetical protein
MNSTGEIMGNCQLELKGDIRKIGIVQNIRRDKGDLVASDRRGELTVLPSSHVSAFIASGT